MNKIFLVNIIIKILIEKNNHHNPYIGPMKKKAIKPILLLKPWANTATHKFLLKYCFNKLKKIASRNVTVTPIIPCSVCAIPNKKDVSKTAIINNE